MMLSQINSLYRARVYTVCITHTTCAENSTAKKHATQADASTDVHKKLTQSASTCLGIVHPESSIHLSVDDDCLDCCERMMPTRAAFYAMM